MVMLWHPKYFMLGRVVQSAKCLTAETWLTADPGVTSLTLAGSHTFLEIDHEIISIAILLPVCQCIHLSASCLKSVSVFLSSQRKKLGIC